MAIDHDDEGRPAKRSIDRVLDYVETDLQWSKAEFGRRLGKSSAVITNWKKRGLPPKEIALVSKVIGRSIDWILGSQRSDEPSDGSHWPFPLSLDEYKSLGRKEQDAIRHVMDAFKPQEDNGGRSRQKKSED